MERISGPRTGSTSGNFSNGSTASFTPKYGTMWRRSRPRSFTVSPSMSLTAIGAICVPATFETSGTVRDARGFASITYTLPFSIANCMFIRPTTFSSAAMRRV